MSFLNYVNANEFLLIKNPNDIATELDVSKEKKKGKQIKDLVYPLVTFFKARMKKHCALIGILRLLDSLPWWKKILHFLSINKYYSNLRTNRTTINRPCIQHCISQ